MRLVDRRTGIEVIDRDECVRLLATQEVGRIGFSTGTGADILPVNYVLDGDSVVFATAAGSKLHAAERGMVAFEVDDTDRVTRSGWSVVIHGRAHELTAYDAPDLVARLRALPLNPWAQGDKPNLVRITPQTMTGRRVGQAGTTA